jgi:hypothetical protein
MSEEYTILFVTIKQKLLRRVQVVGLSGVCNREVAAELTWMYSRVLINQCPAP